MECMECPTCGIGIEIISVNCGIFRCGVYKSTGVQIDPHMPKVQCDAIKDQIYGCATPFKWVDGKLVKCGYE
jgi:hypothetical protein